MKRRCYYRLALGIWFLAQVFPAWALNQRGSLENEMVLQSANSDSCYNPNNHVLSLSSWNAESTLRMVLSDDLIKTEEMTSRLLGYYLKVFGQIQAQPETAVKTSADFSAFRLDEAYVDGEWGEHIYMLAGKKRINWGVGFFSNPVDAINPLKNVADPAHSEEGTPLVEMDIAMMGVTLSGIYSRDVLPDLSTQYNRGGGSLGFLVAGIESKWYGFGGDGTKSLAGTTVRTSQGDFVFYGEAAVRFGSDRIYFGDQGLPFTKDNLQFAGLVGTTYTFSAKGTMTLEYFSDERAYTSEECHDYFACRQKFSSVQPGVALALNSQIGQNLSRHYLGISLAYNEWREIWDLDFRGLLTFDQASTLLFAGVSCHLTDVLTLRLEEQIASGPTDSEYGNALLKNQTNGYVTIYF
jgi:hypothetical protein